jgi:hypothetical protein
LGLSDAQVDHSFKNCPTNTVKRFGEQACFSSSPLLRFSPLVKRLLLRFNNSALLKPKMFYLLLA